VGSADPRMEGLGQEDNLERTPIGDGRKKWRMSKESHSTQWPRTARLLAMSRSAKGGWGGQTDGESVGRP